MNEVDQKRLFYCGWCGEPRKPQLLPDHALPYLSNPKPGVGVGRWVGDWVIMPKDGKAWSMCPDCAEERDPGWLAGEYNRPNGPVYGKESA